MKNLERKYFGECGIKKHDIKEIVKRETYSEGLDENRELSTEIMKKLKGVDLRYYIYGQCFNSSSMGWDSNSKYFHEDLIIPAHWKINGKTAESIGGKDEYASKGENDPYYSINSLAAIDKNHDFKLQHKSLSGKTDIDFTVYYDLQDESFQIIDVNASKVSDNTMWAINEASSMWKNDHEKKDANK